MADNQLLIAWLNDAHAMETSIVESLERQVDMAASQPMVQQGIQRHLDATRNHAEIVKACLEDLGERPSSIKDAMASIGGKVQAMMPATAKDGLVKAALNDYSIEHMEIASYQALIVAATELGHASIVSRLEWIVAEEQAMAGWLEENLPTLVREAVITGSN
jgi:ferritin-like metal-binding protein YciE